MAARLVCRRPKWRLTFLVATLLANLALVAWFFFSSTKTSPPAPGAAAKDEEPILFKKRLQVSLREETVEQSIEQLPDLNDTVATMACLHGNMTDTCRGTYGHAVRYYPSLNRVRKIMEEGLDKRDRVVPILMHKLAHAMDDYKRIVLDDVKELKSRDPVVLTRWSEYNKRRIYLSSAVYLLAEFNSSAALPGMANLFSEEEHISAHGPKVFPQKSKEEAENIAENHLPVNRLFLFYAMHHLVRNHPRDKLSTHARQLLDEYLEASKSIPPLAEVSVPSWRAKFDPWDYRIIILNKDLEMDKQPQIRAYEFPLNPPYSESFAEGDKPHPQVYKFFAEMKRFIAAAYPNSLHGT
jgi:hypothetical protein